MTTYFSSEETREIAYEIAKSCSKTAVRLLDGSEAWSLASLKGKARSYSGSYSKSRDRFLEKLTMAGLQPVTLYLRPHGKRVVVI